jgi:hypothetical protein
VAEPTEQQREEYRQQILAAYGLDSMTPEEQAAFDACGRAVEARKANEAAFGAWVRQRFAETETELRRFIGAIADA